MSNKQKILKEIHPLALIREVELRPPLYTRNNAEIASPHHKLKMWTEVAKSLFPDWDLCSPRTKDDHGLMKKWRNLRDTFRRQVDRNQKRLRDGVSIRKKQYVYYKHMAFLTPHMTDDDERDDSAAAAAAASPAARQPPMGDAAFPAVADFGEIDEDKHFLMSLVPSFKRMNEDEKLTAKMEILKVIKMVKESSASSSAIELSYELVPPEDAPLADVKLEALADSPPRLV